MPGSDPTHWLQRLSAPEWLASADNELALCDEALSRRSYRPAVTHARRAAGMALNAVLIAQPAKEVAWGRSYMEHVVALAAEGDPEIPADVRAAADRLRSTPAAPPALVTLGAPDRSTIVAARQIVDWARAVSVPATS